VRWCDDGGVVYSVVSGSPAFAPLTLRSGLVLANRIALAPLTNLQSLPDGSLGDDELAFLARRADGGFGLVSTCAAYVARDGKAWDGQLGIDRDELLPGLARLATRIRRAGAAAIVQLFHGGVRAASRLTGEPVWSASTWHEEGKVFEPPRPATRADIARVIDRFAAAAARAARAGFDGVELHAAHGYLLSQFLSAAMNLRDDGWGGDLAGRARLVRETLRACRAATGRGFTIGVRLSLEDFGYARGLDLDDSLAVVRWLCEDGADFIHVSLWDAARPTAKRPAEHPVPLARAVMPPEVKLFAAGSIWTPGEASQLFERGADVVALGRAAIINPEWPRQARTPDWSPLRPPLSRAALLERAVSPVFARYLTRWKDFVADA
jgi:2,4-dienoyl-CoA reductase-like NADH-dependent reductase (Old Yellow Enzyme family)